MLEQWGGLGGLRTSPNSPPIKGQCTNHRIAIQYDDALRFNAAIKVLNTAYLSLVNSNPVRWKKPFMAFYIIYTIPEVSKTLCEVDLKEIAQKFF